MKTNKIIYIIIAGLFFLFAGCKDFLDITPNDRITEENFYQNESDFKAATSPLYNKVWFDFNDKFYYALGDGRAYNLYAPYSDYIYPFSDLSETGLTGPLVLAWQAFYNVIQQSNKVIIGINGSSVSNEIKNPYIAEARYIRGVAYWYLASLWGDVIISENPDLLVSNPIVNTNPRKDVFEFAIRDLEYAAKYLSETSGQNGRLTKYSAYGMLSRLYLSISGLSDNPNKGTRDEVYLNLAKQAAEFVITKSNFKLMANYADLFTIENNNNSESLFALQWVPNGDYGVTNTQQAYFACGSEITGDDAAWGYWTRAAYDILLQYESRDIRRKATWMGWGDFYPEISKSTGGFTYEKTREACNVKKGVVGSKGDNAAISRMNSSLNTYMMRLAEVYLIYAEATLGNGTSTSDAQALKYFNAIRIRAGLDAKTSITFEDIRQERRLELCMEGQYWYDLVRWSYYKQQEVINYITAQDRGTITPILYEGVSNKVSVDPSRDPSTRSIGNIDETIFILPYPESELVQNPLLKEAPVPFQFSEDRITDLFQ
ncbi:MAG: RagB/SusD family nutrient uptake outer membrane protein [Tannerella sp.]|jgi:hypothetical protein|nr:RagB/SusD family nutrient uptake outer membrane protein [Tannerella sp.]